MANIFKEIKKLSKENLVEELAIIKVITKKNMYKLIINKTENKLLKTFNFLTKKISDEEVINEKKILEISDLIDKEIIELKDKSEDELYNDILNYLKYKVKKSRSKNISETDISYRIIDSLSSYYKIDKYKTYSQKADLICNKVYERLSNKKINIDKLSTPKKLLFSMKINLLNLSLNQNNIDFKIFSQILFFSRLKLKKAFTPLLKELPSSLILKANKEEYNKKNKKYLKLKEKNKDLKLEKESHIKRNLKYNKLIKKRNLKLESIIKKLKLYKKEKVDLVEESMKFKKENEILKEKLRNLEGKVTNSKRVKNTVISLKKDTLKKDKIESKNKENILKYEKLIEITQGRASDIDEEITDLKKNILFTKEKINKINKEIDSNFYQMESLELGEKERFKELWEKHFNKLDIKSKIYRKLIEFDMDLIKIIEIALFEINNSDDVLSLDSKHRKRSKISIRDKNLKIINIYYNLKDKKIEIYEISY